MIDFNAFIVILAQQDAFLESVVRDERSFSVENFERMVFVLQSRGVVGADHTAKLEELVVLVCFATSES